MRDSVRCPRCKSPARVPCRTRAGVALDGGEIHDARRRAYMAFRRGRPAAVPAPAVAPVLDDPDASQGHPGDDPDPYAGTGGEPE